MSIGARGAELYPQPSPPTLDVGPSCYVRAVLLDAQRFVNALTIISGMSVVGAILGWALVVASMHRMTTRDLGDSLAQGVGVGGSVGILLVLSDVVL